MVFRNIIEVLEICRHKLSLCPGLNQKIRELNGKGVAFNHVPCVWDPLNSTLMLTPLQETLAGPPGWGHCGVCPSADTLTGPVHES